MREGRRIISPIGEGGTGPMGNQLGGLPVWDQLMTIWVSFYLSMTQEILLKMLLFVRP